MESAPPPAGGDTCNCGGGAGALRRRVSRAGGGVRRRRGVGGGGRGGGGDGDVRELGRVGHDAAPRPSSVVVDLVLSIVVVVVAVAAAAAAAAARRRRPAAGGGGKVGVERRRKRAAAGGLRRRLGSGEHLLPAERVGAVGVERPKLAAELAEGGAAKVAAEERAVAREALPPLLRRDGAVAVGVERVEERLELGAALGRAQRLRERVALLGRRRRERRRRLARARREEARVSERDAPRRAPAAVEVRRRRAAAGGGRRPAARARLPDAVEVREVALRVAHHRREPAGVAPGAPPPLGELPVERLLPARARVLPVHVADVALELAAERAGHGRRSACSERGRPNRSPFRAQKVCGNLCMEKRAGTRAAICHDLWCASSPVDVGGSRQLLLL